jgi:uncharacterized protein YjfI (DUF2170 family)
MVDMSRVGEMPEPELISALAGLGRKIDEYDEDIDAFDLLLLKASHLGLESSTYVNILAEQRIAITHKKNLVLAKRSLQSRLVELETLAADALTAAALAA